MNRCLPSVVVSLATAVIGLTSVSSASAQSLGTFRFQFAPFCNVVTVLIEQKGTVFELTGTDDGCDGAAPASTANGSAHFNTGGSSVGISLALVRPDGFVVNNIISLNPGTLAGTWRDDWGNTGNFVFNPPAPVAGSPRRLTMRGDYIIDYPAPAGSSQGAASFAFARQLASAPVAVAANVITVGSAPTANCPGSFTAPEAAPGHLCVYERARGGTISSLRIINNSTNQFDSTTPTGFGIVINANNPAPAPFTFSLGRWAVTVP